MKNLVTIITALVWLATTTVARSALAAPAATCTSTESGNWTDIIWDGCVGGPQSGDQVVIAAGNTVTLDTSTTILSLTVNGTLRFGNDTTSRTLVVTGDVAISSGGTIDISKDKTGHAFNLGGNFTSNGTFDGYQNKNRYIDVMFDGTGQQIIGGSSTPALNDLTIDSGSRVVFPAANLPDVNGSMTVNPGGAAQQTQTVNNGTFNFLQISTSAYRGVDLTTANNLGSTTVGITTTAGEGCTTSGSGSPAYATRCYEITPTNNLTATVRLYALTDTQLNGVTQANLRLYRYAAGGWQQLTTNASTGSASGGYSYAQAETPGFSAFLLGGPADPTAVRLSSFEAQSQAALPLLPIGLTLLTGTFVLFIRRRAQ